MQTQVCVLQTTLDLLERNYDVHVIADGVSSSSVVERVNGIEVWIEQVLHRIAVECMRWCHHFSKIDVLNHPCDPENQHPKNTIKKEKTTCL